MNSYNILVVEDEKEIADAIEIYLLNQGYNVFKGYNGLEGLKVIDNQEIHLAIVDIMMPKINGIAVIQKVRESSTIPIICITAMGSDSDKVLALGIVADYYLVKPISPIELCASVSSHLRRCYRYTENREDTCSTGDLKIYSDTFEVYKGDKKIELNPKEFIILKLLISNAGRVFTKKQIYEQVWGVIYIGDSNNIMVHLSHIREKIEDDPKNPVYIKTIRGIGYKIESYKPNEI